MKSDFQPLDRWRLIGASAALGLLVGLLAAPRLNAQSPDEHASHHPAAAGAGAMPAAAGGVTAPGGAGDMMAGMGEMMKGMMGAPPPKELYPTLMALPSLTLEQRKQVEQQAGERMHAGTTLMGQALDTLKAGTRTGDYAAMHDAMTRLREGAAQFDSGIAARRALAEGRAPRDVALAWFKREMSLVAPVVGDAPHGVRGLSPLHLFTMALLVVFAFAMLAMYFFKMRRAAALFGRIEPSAGSEPPGSSPPLGGGPGPSAPPGGKTPLIGTPPPTSLKPEATPSAPAEKPAVSTPPPGVSSAPATPPNAAAPLTAKWAGRLRVERIVRETPSVSTFRLCSLGGGPLPFTFTPGQFLNVAFGIGGARMNRSYSISSSPNERDYVELTVKREERGAVSRHMVDLLKVGDEIEAGGPVGKFTFTGTEADSVVLIGAGVGITPMMSIARFLTEQSWPGDIFYVYGCRSPTDLIFGKAIAALELRNPKLHVIITMSKPTPDWKGPRGRITKEFLVGAVPDLASRRVQLCGPPTMMDAIKELLTEIGVTTENLKTEAFGAVKPPPATPGISARPTPAATGPLVTFSANNKSAKIRTDQTILELSEDLGIGIQFSCRVGTCGLCKVKMTAGEVDMAIDDALDDDDRKTGVILACQAKPKTEVTVEA
ncbi:MAG: 2Fe-2S iron-sulfur cluster binding domain-containing protein [Opitutaceae bacterium]|nr:2Fe-2S iron-sulfur cluster binding domain-containing protein [Opitutaceae bacterium]